MPPSLCLGLFLSATIALSPAWADDKAKPAPVDPNAPVSFAKQVMPVLQRKCQGCHQPAKAQGKLDLTSFETLKKGGKTGAGFEAGKPDDSTLVDQVEGPKPIMPPTGPVMSPEEVDLVKRWVAQGAKDDTPPAAKDTIDADHPPIYAAPPLTTALAFAPDGQTLAISGYREILIHKADGSVLLKRLVGQSQRIETLTFSPDGSILASVGGSPGRFGEVQFWDAKTYKLKNAVRTSYDTLYGGAFTPDGKKFAFGCADNTARIVNVEDGKEVLRVEQHSDWVFATAFSVEGKHLITLSRDGTIKLIEVATGSFIDDIGKNYGELKALARHPKADQLVIGGDERVPRVYKVFRIQARDMNYTDFNLLKAFEAQPGGPISAVAFSPDGSRIAVGGTIGEVRLYDTMDGSRKATLGGIKGSIYAIAFAPDGKRVAVGGFDGTVRLYDPADGKQISAFVPVPINSPAAVAAEPEMDRQRIIGSWRVITWKVGGEDFPEDLRKAINRYWVIDEKEVWDYGNFQGFWEPGSSRGIPYRLDTTANPKGFDQGDDNDHLFRGIYSLEGDRLTVCQRNNRELTTRRPQSLSDKDSTIVLVFERMKPDDPDQPKPR